MREVEVASTLKEFINDNKDTWVDGLTLDMEPKEIQQVSSSILTPPMLFYFVAVDIRNAISYYDDGGRPRPRNMAHSSLKDYGLLIDEYLVALIVADYAIKTMPLEGEVQSFEEEHVLFRTLTDRMVDALDQQDKFVNADADYTMWIPGDGGDEDRRITKDNRADIWEDDGGQHFGLVTEISFLVKACSSSVRA